ncbi:MAG: tRNA 4-thiouridine(8) synthase ThiI [Clostridia bacterium]|nr:tRNA 4-thiouridine(8) synthase ThiI [Clostridia bacterium]
MKEIILIKDGELALKGLNRSTFEDMLVKNIRWRIKPFGAFDFKKSQSTVIVTPRDDQADMDAAVDEISRVFGIAGYSRAAVTDKDMDKILEVAPIYLKDQLMEAKTFKVNAKRSDKKFPLKSPEISATLGGKLLECFPHLRVDVKNPDIIVTVEIRDEAYIRGNQLKGAGGMPCGSSGRGLILISGGIDSPVAAYMMAKRGIELVGIHFASPPYTSLRAEEKVHDLLSKVARYSGRIRLYTVPFTEIQELIRESCPEEYFTIIMRRFMMRLSNMLAHNTDCHALITGESVAQVASQTMLALGCTDAVAEFPVFRPCIGMDKEEIIKISRKIDTFNISIQPFEDCCTVFTPKHPKTRPQLPDVVEAEKALDIEGLCNRAYEGIKQILITADGVEYV